MLIRALTWNLFHGRDFPPDPALRTQRSRIWRVTERNETHAQVNRSLRSVFTELIAGAEWDVALFQEAPPRWAKRLAAASEADYHRELTSRNSFALLRVLGAAINPDLIGSNEGGSNLTLVRPGQLGEIAGRGVLALAPGPVPERRTLVFTRTASGLCISNMHTSTGPENRARAEDELRHAAERSVEWAAGKPLIFGGDLNVRPRDSGIYDELAERFGLAATTGPGSLDHLLVSGLRVVEQPTEWPAVRREVPDRNGLLIRLSDHAPVEAVFER